MKRPAWLVAVSIVAAAALAACGESGAGGQQGPDGAGLTVVTGAYPLEFAISRVGGEHVQVTNLSQPGADPHDLELTPRQVTAVGSADLVVHLKDFQPALDQAVATEAGDRALDVAAVARLIPAPDHSDHDHDHDHDHDGHDHGGTDPHFWLDPTRLADTGDAIAERLAEIDPDNAGAYRAGAEALTRDLTDLDTRLRTGLQTCTSRELVTGHEAFNYLADRYDLHQVSVAGLTPDAEPSPRQMAALVQHIRQTGVSTVYTETLVSPAVAETVAREAGVRTAVLDPLEGLTSQDPDADYLSVMDQNLATLRTGQGCS